MKTIILGSGIIGVTTAYELAKQGHSVTVIERQPQAANECSYQNGGQLSYSHAQPWATPTILPRILKWLTQKHSPLSIRKPLDIDMWCWMAQFLLSCRHKKMLQTTQKTLDIASNSRTALAQIEQETQISYKRSSTGTLHIFKTRQYLDQYLKHAEFQQDFGCNFELLSGHNAILDKEPSLANSQQPIAGAIFFPDDESGDANEFTLKLAEFSAQNLGVNFQYNTKIEQIITKNDQISHIKTDKGDFTADNYIIALGAYSPLLLAKIGIKLPIYPLKGYSISIPLENPDIAPKTCITDQSNKIVISRLQNSLRIAGTAEFAGYNHDIRTDRIDMLKTLACELFPEISSQNAATWACLRPSTPDGLPIIGKTKYKNLYLNTGHGSLGWTLACGSAKILADVVDNN